MTLRAAFAALLLLAARAGATPAFSGVSFNNPVQRLDKFEITFDLTGTSFSNAYDPAQIDVSALVTSPSGLTRTVIGFYMQNFTRTCAPESLTPGSWKWKFRLSPDELGSWSLQLKAVDSGAGTGNYGPVNFNCTASSLKGYVRVSPLDRRYFQYDDSSQFIPVGENTAFSSTANYYSCDFDSWFAKTAAQGGNIVRFWFSTFNTAVEWNDYGSSSILGNYAPLSDQQARADIILEKARSLDLQVMLTLCNMGDLRATGFENKWPMNVYNSAKGGPCANPQAFFSNASAKTYFKRRLRYIAARWGYLPNLIWETFNEIDFVDNYNSGNIAAWHSEMIDYLHSVESHTHMVTVSYSDPSSEDNNVWALPQIDFTGFHRYSASNTMEDEHLATVQSHHATYVTPRKPVLGGEFGTLGGSNTATDPTGVHFHNSCWGGLMGEAAGTPLFWAIDNYLDPLNLYPQFKGMSNFTAALDFQNSGFVFTQPAISSSSYRNLTITPTWSNWGTPPPQLLYNVNPEGAITPAASQLSVYLHQQFGGSRYNPTTFTVQYAVAGSFAFSVFDASGANNIVVKIDGSQVFSAGVSIGSTYSVPVPAGNHTIFIHNSAGDWIQLSAYYFGNYCSSLKSYVLRGPSTTAGWVVNRDYNYDYVRVNGAPAALSGGVIHLSGMTNGIWNIEWWNTITGVVSSTAVATAIGGNCDVAVPAVSKDWAFKMTLSGVVPTATPTLTATPIYTATATPTPSPTDTPSPSATASPVVCGPTWNFDDLTLQGWARDLVYDTAFSSAASTATMPFAGAASVELGLGLAALPAAKNGGVIAVNGAGFPKDLTGRVLTAHLYIPAGMSQASPSNGAFLYVKTGAGYFWNAATWQNLPSTAGWVTLSYSMTGVSNPADVREIGVKIGQGTGAPDWSGTVYLDSVDLGAPTCATDTPTASPTPSISQTDTPVPPGSSPTSTATPSFTFSVSPTFTVSETTSETPSPSPTPQGTLTHTPSLSPTATLTVSSTATPQGSVTPAATAGYGQVIETLPSLNPQDGAGLLISARINGKTDGFELRVFSKGFTACAVARVNGSYGPGWQALAFDLPELAGGIWYYEIRAINAGKLSGLARIGKVMILR